ncbi:MAG TPA: type II secretion system protein GspM [Solirubrobacteraceae bacterium]|nr:type II secretion system protein GspM [Solirubrobacteraceae bacterium]
MKPRDRLVVCVLVAVAGLAAVWVGVISPKRHDAAQLGSRLTVAQTQLGTAETQLSQAKAAEAQYPENLRVVKSLYKAVPADDGVPRLLVSLDKTSQYKRVDFRVISVAGAAGATGTASAAAASLPAGLSPVSFTFTFNGGYIALQHFLKAVTRYTLVKGSKVVAHGRLLTISSVALTPVQATGASSTPTITGTQAAVTATAYSQQPASSAATPGSGTTTASAPTAPGTSSAVNASTTTPTTR